jgi:hypothetical protein
MNTTDTNEKVAALLAETDGEAMPVWVRAPRAGEPEHYTGLSRGKMYQAEKGGHVKTASLKPPGAIRGVKLFNLKSLLAYIERNASAINQSRESESPVTGGSPIQH